MGLAMLYPEAEKDGRGKNVAARKTQETWGFSSERLRQSLLVLAYSRPMAEEIARGNRSLDEALAAVKEEQTRANGVEAKRERLRKGAPDLFVPRPSR